MFQRLVLVLLTISLVFADLPPPTDNCPPDYQLSELDLSIYSAGAYVASTPFATLSATGPYGAPRIYNTSAGSGEDPDLDMADMGNVLILQQPGVVEPNDSGEGGSMKFQFEHPVFLRSLTFLDVEEEARITMKYRGAVQSSFKSGVTVDGGTKTLDLSSNVKMDYLRIKFPSSGAITHVTACVPTCPPGSRYEFVSLDEGSASAGAFVTSLTDPIPMSLFAKGPGAVRGAPRVYDTNAGSGEDPDLDVARIGYVWILQNAAVSAPNDNPRGGVMKFHFTDTADHPVRMRSLTFLDTEKPVKIRTYAGRTLVSKVKGPALADGAVASVVINDDQDIDRLVIKFPESGAVVGMGVCAGGNETTSSGQP